MDPNMEQNTAASGGMTAPAAPDAAPAALPGALPGAMVGTDEIPNLADPSLRPNEPLMAGVDIGSGPGRSALGPMPPAATDPVRQVLQALDLIYPNPDITRALAQMDYEGR